MTETPNGIRPKIFTHPVELPSYQVPDNSARKLPCEILKEHKHFRSQK